MAQSNNHKLYFSVLILLITFAIGISFSGCVGSTGERQRIRSEYLERHSYQQSRLNDLKHEIEPINNRLHLLMLDSSRQLSNDSIRSLLRESFRVLRKFERLTYEMHDLCKEDSLLFEKYGEL